SGVGGRSPTTAAVIALTPVRRLGTGSGWYRDEWIEGSGSPFARAAATLSGGMVPRRNMKIGTPPLLKRPKSSAPIVGSTGTTFPAPRAFESIGTTLA